MWRVCENVGGEGGWLRCLVLFWYISSLRVCNLLMYLQCLNVYSSPINISQPHVRHLTVCSRWRVLRIDS